MGAVLSSTWLALRVAVPWFRIPAPAGAGRAVVVHPGEIERHSAAVGDTAGPVGWAAGREVVVHPARVEHQVGPPGGAAVGRAAGDSTPAPPCVVVHPAQFERERPPVVSMPPPPPPKAVLWSTRVALRVVPRWGREARRRSAGRGRRRP